MHQSSPPPDRRRSYPTYSYDHTESNVQSEKMPIVYDSPTPCANFTRFSTLSNSSVPRKTRSPEEDLDHLRNRRSSMENPSTRSKIFWTVDAGSIDSNSSSRGRVMVAKKTLGPTKEKSMLPT